MWFKKIETLRDLFEMKLQGLYDVENQLLEALPKITEKATNPQLRQGLAKHLSETEMQVDRLEQVAQRLGLDLDGGSCKAMEGMLAEANALLGMRADASVRDAAIISAAQGVEHYEIAQYGTVVQLAKRLGYYAEAELLNQTLTEEQNANETLNQAAMQSVNEKVLS